MGLNDTPSADRVHIGFFGCRNAGKSSLINAVTGQNTAIVSPTPGTTTDPVAKTMELLPLGPVILIDTPGVDDSGPLGELRCERAWRTLNKVDAAILVIDGSRGLSDFDFQLESQFKRKNIPFLTVFTHADLCHEHTGNGLYISSVSGEGIQFLKDKIAHLPLRETISRPIIRDLLAPDDLVVLVTPIDEAAPKGRLILPQQQTIRDILEANASVVVTKENTLKKTMEKLSAVPKMVVTDSQVFGFVSKVVPENIPLTSFSILLARAKGDLREVVEGARRLKTLQTGERVLIAEGCTHHRQCNDIGSVKLPGWIRQYCHAEPEFHFASGTDFPEELKEYSLIIHCGGCMLNTRELRYRQQCARDEGIPMTNYGIAIAAMHGILERSIQPFSAFFSPMPKQKFDSPV